MDHYLTNLPDASKYDVFYTPPDTPVFVISVFYIVDTETDTVSGMVRASENYLDGLGVMIDVPMEVLKFCN